MHYVCGGFTKGPLTFFSIDHLKKFQWKKEKKKGWKQVVKIESLMKRALSEDFGSTFFYFWVKMKKFERWTWRYFDLKNIGLTVRLYINSILKLIQLSRNNFLGWWVTNFFIIFLTRKWRHIYFLYFHTVFIIL